MRNKPGLSQKPIWLSETIGQKRCSVSVASFGMVWYGLIECAVHVRGQVNSSRCSTCAVCTRGHSCQCVCGRGEEGEGEGGRGEGAKTGRACDRCKSRSTLWSHRSKPALHMPVPTGNATAREASSSQAKPALHKPLLRAARERKAAKNENPRQNQHRALVLSSELDLRFGMDILRLQACHRKKKANWI